MATKPTAATVDVNAAWQNALAASSQSVPAVTFVHESQKNGVDPTTAAVLMRVDQQLAGVVPELTVNSAYRSAAYNASVGGAQSSQHIQGKAIDLDLSGFSPQQKQAVLQTIMAQPEIKGIGVYDTNLNTLHFDTRAGDRVAWGPDYTTKSLGSVLNGYTQPMLTGWLNGASAPTLPAASTATAAASPVPPIPQPRPAQGGSTLAQAAAQPSGSGEVLRGMTPLTNFTVQEPSDVFAGPYGADAAVRAAIAGDAGGFNAAIKSLMDAATNAAMPKWLGGQGLGQDAVVQQLQGYFDALQAQSPGAIRAMQTAYNTNPALQAAIPDALQPLVQGAFAALPPMTGGKVDMPNLRPNDGSGATLPLVAGQPDTGQPKTQLAAFNMSAPAGATGNGLGVGLDQASLRTLQQLVTAGGANAWHPGVARSLEAYARNAGVPGDTAQATSMPAGGAGAQQASPDVLSSLAALVGSLPALLGFSPSAGAAAAPARSAASASPYRSSLTGGYGAANGWQNPPPGFDPNDYDPLANAAIYNKMLPRAAQPQTGTLANVPNPQPIAQPQAPQMSMLDQNVLGALSRGAPVDMQATYANDPYAQPGTENTPVLQDMGMDMDAGGSSFGMGTLYGGN